MALLCTVALCTASCDYKNLDDEWYADRKNQSIALMWDYGKIDSVPGSFRVSFWPSDEATLAKVPEGLLFYDVYNGLAVLSDLPSGNYKVTAWNTDTEHNIIEDKDNRDGMYATTTAFYTSGANPSNVLDSLYYGQPILDTPDYMVHANKESVTVLPEQQNQPMTLIPDSMCVAVDYRIHGVASLHLASQIRAAMNNVTKKRYLAYGNMTQDTCVVMADCMAGIQDSTVYGRFFVYGMEPGDFQKMDHTLTLFFWMEEKNVYFPIQVNTFLKPYTKNDRIIYLDIPNVGLDLRNYVSSGSFEVNVKEWDDIEQDIEW